MLSYSDATAMDITRRIGTYTTSVAGTSNRLTNVGLGSSLLNNSLIGPGKVFSVNATTGQRTAAKGFKMAPTIIAGKLEDTVGGGMCQVSTTVFNAAFEAGLQIVERHNHELYISHYPLGRDATVSYGSYDLKFRNDTPHWILLKTAFTGWSLTVSLYSAPLHRKVVASTSAWYGFVPFSIDKKDDPTLAKGQTKVDTPGVGGMSIDCFRKVYDADGKLIWNDDFKSVYSMVPEVLLVGTKAPKPTALAQALAVELRLRQPDAQGDLDRDPLAARLGGSLCGSLRRLLPRRTGARRSFGSASGRRRLREGEGELDGLLRALGPMEAVGLALVRRHRPAFEQHHLAADRAREADLGQRAPGAAQGDDHVAAGHHREVAGVAQAGEQREREVGRRAAAVEARQDADAGAAAAPHAAGDGLHDARHAAVDHHAAALGEQLSELLAERGHRGAAGAAADHADVGRGHQSIPSEAVSGVSTHCVARGAAVGVVAAATSPPRRCARTPPERRRSSRASDESRRESRAARRTAARRR